MLKIHACLLGNGPISWKHYVELNVQLALDKRVLVHGHSLIVDRLDVTRLDHLTGSSSARNVRAL